MQCCSSFRRLSSGRSNKDLAIGGLCSFDPGCATLSWMLRGDYVSLQSDGRSTDVTGIDGVPHA